MMPSKIITLAPYRVFCGGRIDVVRAQRSPAPAKKNKIKPEERSAPRFPGFGVTLGYPKPAPCSRPGGPPPPHPAPLGVPYPFLLPAVGGEVVDGDLHALALLQLLQGGDDEVEVEGIGVVEVEIVAGRLLLLLLGQYLSPERSSGLVAVPLLGQPLLLLPQIGPGEAGGCRRTHSTFPHQGHDCLTL